MLGYGTETKAHQLYHIEWEKVFFSRDVVFNKSKNGFMETKSSDADTKCVQLECLNEESHSESNFEEENQESPQEEDSNTVL